MSLKGQVNVYRCPVCQGETVTIDVDEGTTPFLLRCRATEECKGNAISSMYKPRPDHGPVGWEWYRPTDEEVKKATPGMREHALFGGLFIRKKLDS